MQIQNNISLSSLTTMRLGGTAREVATFSTKEELEELVSYASQQQKPFFVVGGGSNIIASAEDYPGIILLSRVKGFDVIEDTDSSTIIRIGAGENWDETVERTTNLSLSGCEAMSAIPGTVGATPVQNVGAYGQEISDTFVELEAYDTFSNTWVTLDKETCRFSYRNSIFKDPATRHHIIFSVTLRLQKTHMQPPFYNRLQKYLDDNEITDYSPASIRQAIVDIRSQILPDPRSIANTGSFFKNPIVSEDQADLLLSVHPEMPSFPAGEGKVKLAAGWLIDQAGLRGYSAHGFQTYQHNALVVVNISATDYSQLANFRQDIVSTVYDKFGVTLEQEPELLSVTY